MEDMNLFNSRVTENVPVFEEHLAKFYSEINPSYHSKYRYIKDLEPYLNKLFKEGKLQHNKALDALVSMCFCDYIDEYDLKYTFIRNAIKCLNYGATVEEVMSLNLWELCSVTSLHKYEPENEIDISKEIALARLLPREQSDLEKLFNAVKLTKEYFKDYGIVLFRVKMVLEPCYDIVMEYVSKHPDWDIFDILNFAFMLNRNYSINGSFDEDSAYELIKPIINKKYSTEMLSIMLAAYKQPLSGIVCDNLMSILVMNESVKGTTSQDIVHLHNTLSNYVSAKSIDLNIPKGYVLAIIQSVYEAGFSMKFLQTEDTTQYESMFVSLIDFAMHINYVFQQMNHLKTFKRPANKNVRIHTKAFVFDDEEYYVLSPDIILEEARVVLVKSGFSQANLDYTKYHWRYAIARIYRWLTRKCSSSSNMNGTIGLEGIFDKTYSEIQIALNGEVMYQMPVDFFIEYEEELIAWYNSNNPQYYLCADVMSNNERVLLIAFSDSGKANVITRSNPLGITVDLATKKALVFENTWRYDMPILKMMLYKHFQKHNKDTSIIEKLDLQTVIGMIQVLILQNSEDYETLFNRADSFLTGFKAMKHCVRADDNFNSAVLRYIVNVSGTYSKFFNNKISNTLQNYVIVNNNKVPLLGVFAKDMSLINYLKEHKGSVKIEIKEDVVHFD